MRKSTQLLITPSQRTNRKASPQAGKLTTKKSKAGNRSLYTFYMDIISDELQAPDGAEDQPEEAEAGKNCNELAQHTFYNSNYNHHYEEPQDFTAKSLDNFNVANAISTAESHKKIHSERILQESSRIMKPKRRKAEMFEVHSGRIIRSTSRKDRHSKVCTTRGPKDRRVRLSPTTAIQFYDVQDRLGYDRPSKAIDWLMKEAKTAIEALNGSQAFASYKHLTAANAAKSHSQMQQGSASGMIQKHESSNNADNPISSFGVFVNGDHAPLPITDDFNSSRVYQEQGFLSALATTSQILDANMQMAKLQRIFTWNYDDTNAGDSTTLQYPLPPGLSHSQMFSQREPLQSSFINYSTVSNESPRLNFYSEELSNFTAATLEESEKDKIPVSGNNSSASFLHMED